ncbi:PREDICTED: uncharacterized protein LOC106808826 isoform X2 [Priapulus caudatus]|uniref:Uncharacterized protein LOC106808826 isoform X2 n=1 Tax=Priapulus caudatus TaxID=37621 RepID=A0ABM1E4R2_PRICU|nr:PREDICTED: uncharacterized protein LOC106808826 isoform X2 [Priapulus caudatus]
MHFYALSSLLLVSVTLSLALPAAEEVDLAPFADHLRDKRATGGDWAKNLAQAVCTALNPSGWMFAVSRDCKNNKPTCAAICASAALHNQDNQTKNKVWSCVNSLHVYSSPASTSASFTLGPKVYKYNTCKGGCGPNHCCCRAEP